jgi:hypothetical protein
LFEVQVAKHFSDGRAGSKSYFPGNAASLTLESNAAAVCQPRYQSGEFARRACLGQTSSLADAAALASVLAVNEPLLAVRQRH